MGRTRKYEDQGEKETEGGEEYGYQEGYDTLVEGGHPGEGGFWGGVDGVRSYVESGSPNPQGKRRLQQ